MEGPASSVELQLYTVDLALARRWELAGPFSPGWDQASVDLDGLANGIYFYSVVAKDGGGRSPRVLGKMAILR